MPGLDLRASLISTCCPVLRGPNFTGHPMHGAGRGDEEGSEDYYYSGGAGEARRLQRQLAGRERSNNDWMTHHLSQQQPLAQWIQDRQKAFADFSQSLIAPPDTYQDYWPRPRQLEFSPVKASNRMLASNTAELSPKAKVSYDEGQFVVEIPLKDYRVSL